MGHEASQETRLGHPVWLGGGEQLAVVSEQGKKGEGQTGEDGGDTKDLVTRVKESGPVSAGPAMGCSRGLCAEPSTGRNWAGWPSTNLMKRRLLSPQGQIYSSILSTVQDSHSLACHSPQGSSALSSADAWGLWGPSWGEACTALRIT